MTTGLTVVDTAPAHADESFGTITGTVTFGSAPSWDAGGKNFVVSLIDYSGYQVDDDLVPITYSYDGSGGYTITYPNADNYYNDYFNLNNTFTVRIQPFNPAYASVYLGGAAAPGDATQLDLFLPTTTTNAGNTNLPIRASISGKVTFPGGNPSGGVTAIAQGRSEGATGAEATVEADGTYHLVGLAAGNYAVGFVPYGGGSGPGAGVWWSSKLSFSTAGIVTVTASQQRANINQALPAGGIITGRLTDSQGDVVVGAVAIYNATGTGDSEETLVQEKWVEEDGTYAFWGLPNGKYRVGFDTGIRPNAPSALEVRNLDGSPRLPSAPTVDIDNNDGGATDGNGSLAASTYPWASAWYIASAGTYATAKNVTISTTVPMVGNVDGVLPLDPLFLAWQEYERISGHNPSEKDGTCACADPVDTLSGEFSEFTQDLDLPGVGVPVQLDRTYSASLSSVDGPFGFGSSSSLSAHVDEVPGTEQNRFGTVVVTQESGATVMFTALSPRGQFMAPSRVNSTLRYDRSHDEWVFTRNAVEVLRFTEQGALLSHRDLHGNIVSYSSDESQHVTSIEGTGGRVIAITWSGDHIASATDSAGRTVSYEYDDGELISFTAVDGRETTFTHDSSHRVTTITSPGGGVVTNAYDEQGRVVAQTDPLGRATTFAYAGTAADATTTVTNPVGVATKFHYVAGALVSQTQAFGTTSAATTTLTYDASLNVIKRVDALNKATVMTYDADGNMLTSTDPLGHTTTYTYDAIHDVTSVTDPLGHTTTYTYDAIHDVTSVTDPLGRVSTATYDSSGSKTSATSPNGAVTTWVFNSDGTQAASIDPLGHTGSYGYDAAGLRTSTTDPLGRTTLTSYDAAGHPTLTTDASGATSTLTVDAAGRPLSATDALGNITEYAYDAYGNQTSLTDADGKVTTSAFNLANELVSKTNALGYTTTYTYTPLGKPSTTTDPLGGMTSITYDALGRPTVVTDAKNLKTTTTYNKNGQVVQKRSPAGNITKATYDAAGRLITSTDPLGNVTVYAYDAADQLSSVTDPIGRVTSNAYDPDGHLITVTGPDGHAESIAYDPAGHQTAFTDADGNTTGYVFDDAGQISSRTAPGGLITTYQYDAIGQVTTLTKPDGTTITSEYNSIGRLLTETPSVGTETTYTYDAVGRRSTMSDETGTTTYQYSAIGQVTSVTDGAGQTVTYGFDAAGRNISLGYPGGKTVSYAYDADGRMTSLTDWANRKFTFTWTSDSLPLKLTDPNKVATTYTYNKNNLATAITIAKTSTPAATLASYLYGYDAASQLTSTTLSDPLHTASGGDTTAYGYDARGQLTTAGTGGAYESTPAGSLSQSPGSVNTFNTAQQITRSEGTLSPVVSEFSYDGNGARTGQVTTTPGGSDTTTYTHSWRGDLASVSTATTAVSYSSNGDGLRASRTDTSGTDQWLWDPTSEIPLLLKGGQHTYIYGPTLTPLAEVDGAGAIRYLHSDNVGSVRLITSSAAAVVTTTNYSPYGVATSAGTKSRFGYAGAWTDPTTGLDYLRAREYDPTVGQFLQVDPVQDNTRQPYSYVGNDPLAQSDPTGLCVGKDRWGRSCEYAQFFWDGLGPSIAQAGCGISDLWTCANMKLNPVLIVMLGVDKCSHEADVGACLVMTFDPFYAILDGAGRLPDDIASGCGLSIAEDIAEIVGGAAGTVGIAAGSARPVLAVKGIDWADEIGAIGPGVGELRFARSVNLPVDSAAVVNRAMTVQDFVSQFLQARVLRELPGNVLNGTVEDALRGGNSTVRKLLTDGRWAK